MSSYNKIILLGNLTRDPQLTYTAAGMATVDITVATSREYKVGTETHKSVCFIDCRCYGKRAEAVNTYLKKGSQVHCDGYMQFESWAKQDGTKASRLRMMIESIMFLSRNDAAKPQTQQQQYNNTPQANNAPAGEFDDNDLPF